MAESPGIRDTRSSTMSRSAGDNNNLYHTMCAITQEYNDEVNQIIVEVGQTATKRLVKRTRETAPVGRRLSKRRFDEGRPHLFESISMMRVRTVYGRSAFLWYVRAPNSRIAHLVEHGYWNQYYDFGYSGSHFLRKAVKVEEEQYHKDVIEALNAAGYAIQMKYAQSTNLNYKHTVVKIDGK